MKNKIIKISSIALVVAIMLFGTLSASVLPPKDPSTDSELILYGDGSGVYVDGKKIGELQYNTNEVNKIYYFAIDSAYYRIANGFKAELSTPLVFELTYATVNEIGVVIYSSVTLKQAFIPLTSLMLPELE